MDRRMVQAIGVIGCVSVLAMGGTGAEKMKGKAAAGAEKAALTHVSSLLKAGSDRVYIACTSVPIPPELQKSAQAEQSFVNALNESIGPYIEVMLGFTTGAKTASLKTLDYYYVAFLNFRGGPMTANLSTTSREATVTMLSGDLRKGGTIKGKLKGTTEGMEKKKYTWELDFTTELR